MTRLYDRFHVPPCLPWHTTAVSPVSTFWAKRVDLAPSIQNCTYKPNPKASLTPFSTPLKSLRDMVPIRCSKRVALLMVVI